VKIGVACLAVVVMFSGCEKPEDTKGKPSAVMNFTATAGNGQVSLSWDAPSNNGGSEVTGYEVTMDNWTNKVTKTASERSHTYTGLTNGTKYTFKVRAVNANGNGAEATATATPGGGESSGYFTVKAGTVVYRNYNENFQEWHSSTIMFDDYGKKIRFETEPDENGVIGVCINNETTGKGYVFAIGGGAPPIYSEVNNDDLLPTYKWKGYDEHLLPGYRQEPDRTIAGKICSVYSIGNETVRNYDAGWNEIRFYWGGELTNPTQGKMEAVSFSEAVPSADKFLPPSGYTKD